MLTNSKGQHPYIYNGDIQGREFTITQHSGTEKPKLFFEDMCRAVLENGKKYDLQNADLATDTSTLWAIFHTIYKKVMKWDVANEDKGITLVLHLEGATTYVKVLDDHAVDDDAVVDATAELKRVLRGRPTIKAGPNNDDERLTVFKRVVKYELPGIRCIVQDDNQIDPSQWRQNAPRRIPYNCLQTKDGAV